MSNLRSLHEPSNLVHSMRDVGASVGEEDELAYETPIGSGISERRLHVGEQFDILLKGSMGWVGLCHLGFKEEMVYVGSLVEVQSLVRGKKLNADIFLNCSEEGHLIFGLELVTNGLDVGGVIACDKYVVDVED